MNIGAYKSNRVTRSDGKDIGTRYNTRADLLNFGLDGINHIESSC